MATQYKAIETFVKVADATDVTNDYVEFTLPYTATGAIAAVRTSAGVENVTGLTITFPTGKIRVAVTAITLGDVVSVIVFNQ